MRSLLDDTSHSEGVVERGNPTKQKKEKEISGDRVRVKNVSNGLSGD